MPIPEHPVVLDAAGEYLEQAINLDPDYGLAWSRWPNLSSDNADNGWVAPTEGFERARTAGTARAAAEPGSCGGAQLELQYVHLTFDWDWAAAEAEEQRRLPLIRPDPWVLEIAGILLARSATGTTRSGKLRAALVRDPLNTLCDLESRIHLLPGAVDSQESEGMYRRLLELEPDFLWTRGYLGQDAAGTGQSGGGACDRAAGS